MNTFKTKTEAVAAAIAAGLSESDVTKLAKGKYTFEAPAAVSYIDLAIPHDLAEGEADVSLPLSIEEMSDEEFARIMIAGGAAKAQSQSRKSSNPRTRSGTYEYPSNYPKREGACKLIWDTLTALWESEGKPSNFALTATERETMRVTLGVQKSTMNMQFLCWRKWAGIEVAGRAAPTPVSSSDISPATAPEPEFKTNLQPTSIDDVEVIEV